MAWQQSQERLASSCTSVVPCFHGLVEIARSLCQFSSLTAGHGWLEAEAEAFQIEPGKDSTSTLTTAAWRQISGIQS